MPPKASSSRHARSPSSSAREEAALGLSALPGSPALTASRRRRRRGDDEQPEESTPTGGASAATTAGGPSPYASPTRRSFAAGPSAAAGPSNVPEQSPQQQQQQQQRTPRGAVSAVASSPGALSAVEELSPGPETKLSTSAASGADKTEDEKREIAERRAIQNRKAQKEFRQRRAQYLRDLEEKSAHLEAENSQMRIKLDQALEQIDYLRSILSGASQAGELGRPSSSHHIAPPLPGRAPIQPTIIHGPPGTPGGPSHPASPRVAAGGLHESVGPAGPRRLRSPPEFSQQPPGPPTWQYTGPEAPTVLRQPSNMGASTSSAHPMDLSTSMTSSYGSGGYRGPPPGHAYYSPRDDPYLAPSPATGFGASQTSSSASGPSPHVRGLGASGGTGPHARWSTLPPEYEQGGPSQHAFPGPPVGENEFVHPSAAPAYRHHQPLPTRAYYQAGPPPPPGAGSSGSYGLARSVSGAVSPPPGPYYHQPSGMRVTKTAHYGPGPPPGQGWAQGPPPPPGAGAIMMHSPPGVRLASPRPMSASVSRPREEGSDDTVEMAQPEAKRLRSSAARGTTPVPSIHALTAGANISPERRHEGRPSTAGEYGSRR